MIKLHMVNAAGIFLIFSRCYINDISWYTSLTIVRKVEDSYISNSIETPEIVFREILVSSVDDNST